MSLSNTTENADLKMFLQGTDPSYRVGATQYLALFTADPTESGSVANEANYTGYARVALTKASAWTDGGATFTNAANASTASSGARLPETSTDGGSGGSHAHNIDLRVRYVDAIFATKD